MNTQAASVGTPEEASTLAGTLRTRLAEFVAPLVRELDFWIDARLVRTLVAAVEAILQFRNRAQGLLLSELGAHLLSPEHAPAGTKRLSNLLRCDKWSHKRIGRFLWERACTRLKELETAGDEALLLWDQSVLEKPESLQAEGLCAVRSTKAARLKRIKPGFYNPPGGRPLFVPGMQWLAVMLAGLSPRSGPAHVAFMQWWTTRGEHATDARTLQAQVLAWCAKAWRQRVLHVFDRGYAGHFWLSTLVYYRAHFVLRWPNRFRLIAVSTDGKPLPREDAKEEREGRAAWKLAAGKKAWDHKQVYDTHARAARSIAILALPVRHPQLSVPLWLVVARSGYGREPWYLLTNERVETKAEAWKIYFTYHRRWQVEMAFRFNKCELAMESPRLWAWERRLKLLSLVTLAYAFLLCLLNPGLHAWVEVLLRHFCHRTGKRSRETSAPLYRLRATLSRLWLTFPRHPVSGTQAFTMNPG
jgi:hypothetical protein